MQPCDTIVVGKLVGPAVCVVILLYQLFHLISLQQHKVNMYIIYNKRENQLDRVRGDRYR